MNASRRKVWLALGAAGLLAAACSDQGNKQSKAPGQQGQTQTASNPAANSPDPSQRPGATRGEPGTSQQTASSGSQSASGTSQPTAASSGSEAEKTVSGKIVRASEHEVVLKPASGSDSEIKLKMSSSTPVTIDGRQGTATDLKEGAQVRASYQESGGASTATKIDAQSGGSSAGGSQPGQGSGLK